MKLVAFVDGAARGNPGKSGIGIMIRDETGAFVDEHCAFLGTATNNVAEYTALITCLGIVSRQFPQCTELHVHSDSELMVKQMNGQYKVRDRNLQKLNAQVRSLLEKAPYKFSIRHIPREENSDADALANRGIDEARN